MCADKDECAQDPDICHAESNCVNTDGGFVCQCQSGFYSDGSSCVDINECIDDVCTGEFEFCENLEVKMIVIVFKYQVNFFLYSPCYAEACNEFAGPISASLRPGKQFVLKKYRCGGEPMATLCPI